MIFTPTGLEGAFLIEPELISDERGFFTRTFCQNEFELMGLSNKFVQNNISQNKIQGTLRGMHFQKRPFPEAKLLSCIHGGIYDVIVDLRAGSSTFTHWFGANLTAENRKMLYIPEGFAHGFLTLFDDSQILYQMSEFFQPQCSAGVRWNDSAFAINWPGQVLVISDQDATFPDFDGVPI
jgi:dTDP-4-dehydrorhamnose 3,5-epimerase